MKFLVIGETCSDRFCYGSAERLCPEAPAPVFVPDNGVGNLGMATNVQQNILAIDNEIHKNSPYRNKVELFTNETVGHKTRYIDSQSNQMFLRVDTDSYSHCGSLPKNLEEYDAVIISDYNKGFLKDSDLQEIARRSRLSFLDTKKQFNIDWADYFTFVKINEKEYLENGWKHRAENVIVTKAERGCSYKDQDFKLKNPSEIRDVSGAGDTFLAAFSYGFTSTQNIKTAIIFAQDCCQKVIRKKGVSTV
jgi:D-beta-D-heptose 7-phosphate kinase/D-beta-D-heptose 1-phosphate adenosyltransferase